MLFSKMLQSWGENVSFTFPNIYDKIKYSMKGGALMTLPDLSKVTAILPDLADYIVYAAIAVVTAIGFLKCLIPLWNTSAALRRAIRRL